MKKVVLGLTVCFSLYCGVANASFPVEEKARVVNVEKKSGETTPVLTESKQQNQNAEKFVTKKSETEKSTKVDDEMLITLLLFLLLGIFAAHRWYKNKPVGANILFILTAGGCGIWAIIDLIRIIKGDF